MAVDSPQVMGPESVRSNHPAIGTEESGVPIRHHFSDTGGGSSSPVTPDRQTELPREPRPGIPWMFGDVADDAIGGKDPIKRAFGAWVENGQVRRDPNEPVVLAMPDSWGPPTPPTFYPGPDGVPVPVQPWQWAEYNFGGITGPNTSVIGPFENWIGPTVFGPTDYTFVDIGSGGQFPKLPALPGLKRGGGMVPPYLAPDPYSYYCPMPPGLADGNMGVADQDIDLGEYGIRGIGWSAPWLKEADGRFKDGEVYVINEGNHVGWANDLNTAIEVGRGFFAGWP